jgi:hypothetical protein
MCDIVLLNNKTKRRNMQITLAKALKLKNRLVKKLTDARNEIILNNQIMVGNNRNIDIDKQIKLVSNIQSAIINLKTAINQANLGITSLIYINAEIKGEILFLHSIPHKEGKDMQHNYSGSVSVEYSSIIGHQIITQRITELEHMIDENQEKMDTHNHTTNIEVPAEVFDLLKG